ncbi:MAG: response regulator [Clostridia bacterium]|nr:response regulator [Clostridia bacterium]
MYRILIVDDEILTRKNLCRIIETHLPDCEVCAEAEDGEDGLELTLSTKPHIIITDICMAEMDGLNMVQKLTELPNHPEVIILTAHRNFSYAKRSIDLNVSGFILKPTKTEEVIEQVNHAIARIRSKGVSSETFNAFLPYIQQQLLIEYFHGNPVEDSLKECGISLGSCYLIRFSPVNDRDDLLSYVNTRLSRTIENNDLLCIRYNDSVLAIILCSNHFYNMSGVSHICNEIIAYADENLHHTIYAGITSGNLKHSPAKIYEENKDCVNFAVFSKSAYALLSSEIRSDFRYRLYRLSSCKKELSQLVKNGDRTGTETVINRILTELEGAGQQYIQETRQALGSILSEMIAHPDIRENKYLIQKTDLNKYDSQEELKKNFKQSVVDIFNSLNSNYYNISTKRMNKIYDYISSNYHRNITAHDIAEYIHVSPSYLSKLFKQESGKKLVDFINEYRITKAKSMIDSCEYKMYEISEKVGFENPHYFSKIFRRYIGMTPSEYMNHKNNSGSDS